MMRCAKDAVFVTLVALILILPAVCLGVNKLGVTFPEWTGVGGKRSSLEGRVYTKRPKVTTETLMDGKFQGSFEKWMSDTVPLRDSLILDNAAIQRLSISVANVPFGFSAYHTFYASDKVYLPGNDALSYAPAKATVDDLSQASTMLSELRGLAKDYPRTVFAVYTVQGMRYPAFNPAYDYVSARTNGREYVQELMRGIKSDVPDNVVLLDGGYDEESDFYGDFYHTDHHWNSRGAIRAFNVIADAVGIGGFVSPGTTEIDGYRFSGAIARSGRATDSETAIDCMGDVDLTLVSPKGEPTVYNHAVWEKDHSLAKRYAFHDEYYDFVESGSQFINNAASGKALLICDSYGADIGPLMGLRFGRVDYVKDLHGSAKTDKEARLRKRLEEGQYDCVVFVAASSNYTNLAKRSPHYLQ